MLGLKWKIGGSWRVRMNWLRVCQVGLNGVVLMFQVLTLLKSLVLLYPKQRIRDVQNWNWFLEEPSKESDDDEYEGKKRRGGRRKRKKGEEDDNEEWTGDSEADEELVAKLPKVNKPKYSTRSKACKTS